MNGNTSGDLPRQQNRLGHEGIGLYQCAAEFVGAKNLHVDRSADALLQIEAGTHEPAVSYRLLAGALIWV